MLLGVLKFIKDKVLIVAFLVLSIFCIWQYVHYHNIPSREVIKYQLIPTQITHDNGVEHAKVTETHVDKQQMKQMTKADKKELHAKKITSSTELVDHNTLTIRDDTIKLRRYDTRKWFLSPIEHKIDITHSDTTIHSTFAKSLSYTEPRSMIVFGPYIGYDVLHNHFAFGVSATFNIISIKYKR